MEIKTLSLYLMAAFYCFVGITHFTNTKFFLRIMPPYLPWHKELVYISGVIEIGLGLMLLWPLYSHLAAWGIILLLLAIFPANLYHYTSGGAGMKIPKWALLVRLPFQLVFIAWAYWHTY
ncbi:MAG: DoxX family protein [Leptospiraceae bacterium]|nr:DoxX family protein [Leptospiraceae bacterium]